MMSTGANNSSSNTLPQIQPITRESIAHAVLSRYLPSFSRIITTASFCHVYRGAFDTDSSGTFSWEKKDISGSLFLVATSPSPGEEAYHLVILNRQNVNNFIWTLASTECIEDDGEHLVFSNTSGFSPIPASEPGYEIDEFSCWGIWVFPNLSVVDERTRMLDAVMDCARRAEARKHVPPAPPSPPQPRAPEYENGDGGASLLGGYSIMSQVFPQAVTAPSPSQFGGFPAPPPDPQYPPYPTPQLPYQQMPQDGGEDILGQLFESARQRRAPQPPAGW